MTTPEMSKLFDIRYDNISSNAAPGLNEYEKSVFLTQSQDELVKERYSPFNKIKKGFEASQNRRGELRQLVKPWRVTSYATDSDTEENNAIDDNSKFFLIPSDIYYIIQEEVTLISTDTCINGLKVKVIPITHDEYNISKTSPFRKPNKRKVWRMDLNDVPTTTEELGSHIKSHVEIISEYDISEYKKGRNK